MDHKERLLAVLKEAIDKDGCVWMEQWPKQVKADRIESAKFGRWLRLLADYWTEKDREYGAYIRHLVKTNVAVIRGCTVEEVGEVF